MSLNYVTLLGNFGAAGAGSTVLLTPSGWLNDPVEHQSFPPASETITVPPSGKWSALLLATDNSQIASGWAWSAEVLSANGVEVFSFYLPYASGAVQYFDQLAPVAPPTGLVGFDPAGAAAAAQVAAETFATAAVGTETTRAETEEATLQSQIGTRTFTQAFTSVSSVSVTHNLGKFPAVTVMDSSDDVVIGDVVYLTLNTLTVSFSAPFSGTVICN